MGVIELRFKDEMSHRCVVFLVLSGYVTPVVIVLIRTRSQPCMANANLMIFPKRSDQLNQTASSSFKYWYCASKFKRRLRYKSHFLYENIRSEYCLKSTKYLLQKRLLQENVPEGLDAEWLNHLDDEMYSSMGQFLDCDDMTLYHHNDYTPSSEILYTI